VSYKILNRNGDWLVQVQRGGVRRTQRGGGGEGEAKKAEALLLAELHSDREDQWAAKRLGLEHPPLKPSGAAVKTSPTLRAFHDDRWLEHAKVVQNDQTRRTMQCPFNYLLYYLGEKRIDDLLLPTAINSFVEEMKKNGPISFRYRRDGQPRKPRCEVLCHNTINKSLQCLQALLNLAHAEQVLGAAPRVDMLPTDDSRPVLPPTEEQFQALLARCADFRGVAPLMAEVVEFDSETGLRRAEIFNLTWGSVDLARAALRVEMQSKARLVNGKVWRPKHNKWREIPLSARARTILEDLGANRHTRQDELVFPSKGGAPYDRLDRAPEAAGKGYFPDAVDAAGLRGKVTFHGLRHLFAVRLLTRGVPITVVSDLLGHSDVNLTVKRYGRFASDARVKWDAVKTLDSRTPPIP
jgi:integrase